MIRLLSYNLHGGVGRDGVRDYARLTDFFEKSGADIVLLQEVETRPSKKGTPEDFQTLCGDYPYAETATTEVEENGWYGNVILSRFPLDSVKVTDLAVVGREPRNLMDAQIATPQGPLRVMNTHLGLLASERRTQGQHVLDALETIKKDHHAPLVLAGDINEWRSWTPLLSKLKHALTYKKCGATWPSFCPFMHLDRVWCDPPELIQSIHALRTEETRVYSDHLPVLAEIETL